MISCNNLLLRMPRTLRMPITRKSGLKYLSSTAFDNSVKDALKTGEKYGTLSLAILAILGAVAGVSITLTANDEKIKSLEKLMNEKINSSASDEKIASLEKLMDEKINSSASDEKIASLEKLMDEKINSSVQKSVHVALENFLKYSYSNEYKGMRDKQAKQSLVSKDDDITSDISDDNKNKTKE